MIFTVKSSQSWGCTIFLLDEVDGRVKLHGKHPSKPLGIVRAKDADSALEIARRLHGHDVAVSWTPVVPKESA